jgi:hypothetical protein
LTQFSVCYNSINWVWSSLELQNERFFLCEWIREREREREREIFAMCIGMWSMQELEEMRKQIIEARRIKMLHEPSKVWSS